MGIFSKIEDAARNVEAEYKDAIAVATADSSAIAKDVEAVAERVEDVVETLESRALSEIEWFLGTVEETLTKLQDYESKLKADIEAKSSALAKVQDTIAKVQAVTPTVATSNTSEDDPAAPVGTAPVAQAS